MADKAISVEQVLDFIGVKETLVYKPKESEVSTTIPAREIFTSHPEMLRFAIIGGMFGKLGNTSKSGLKTSLKREATDKDLERARNNIVDVWKTGSWNATGGGGERETLPYWDAYFAAIKASDSKAQAKARKDAKALVESVYGKDEAATFGRFLDAIANTKAKATGDDEATLRDALDAKWNAKAIEHAKVQNEAVAAVNINIDEMF